MIGKNSSCTGTFLFSAALAATASAQIPFGSLQCAGEPNSTGARASLRAFGNLDPAQNDLRLLAAGMPPHGLAIGLVGRSGARVPLAGGGAGTLCLGSGFGRLSNQVVIATPTGEAALDIDLTHLPGPMGSYTIVRGDTLRFQVWYRDIAAGGLATSNLTDAVTVTFATRPWFDGEAVYVGNVSDLACDVRDIDRDGFGDALVASLGGLMACLGRGDGSFEPGFLLSEIAGPRAVFPLQLDGDGALDFLVTTSNSGGETVLVRGSFPPAPRPSEPAPFARAGVVAIVDDRDGDGAVDAVLVDRQTLRAVLYHGDGLGGFVEVAELAPVGLMWRGVFRDVDGDGDRDVLLWRSNDNDVQVVRDLGGGMFGSPELVTFPASALSLSGAVTDIDSDGFPDIVAGGNGFVSVRRNRGDGTFGLEARFDAPTQVSVVGARDTDGDQDLDLLVVGTSSTFATGSDVYTMENLGQSVLRASPAPSAVVRGTGTPLLVDLDGQGELDLLGIDSSRGALFGTVATGLASFAPPIADAMTLVFPPNVLQVELGDFDGDGDEECLVLSHVDLDWAALTMLEIGPTGFNEVGRWRIDRHAVYPVFACADFDGDGRHDIVYPTTSGLVVASLQVQGHLTPFGPPDAGLGGVAVPSDFDGDGDVDVIAWSTTGTADLVFAENTGGGVLVPRPGRIPPSTTTAVPSNISVADMDNDGDLDFVALNSSWNWVRLYENLGGATFAAKPDILATNWVRRVETVDLDGDGDNDVVVFASQSVRHVMWNDGAGVLTVTSPQIYTGDGGGFADVDGDGDADLAFASMMNGFARIDLSNGQGGFERQIVLTHNLGNNFNGNPHVRFGDLDGDGDRDFVLLLYNRLYVALSRVR